MSSLTLAKLAINVVSGIGISKIISDVVKNNTVVLTTAQKVTVNAGTFVLGSMVCEQAINHVNRTVDQLVEEHKNRKDENKGTQATSLDS